MKPEDSKSAFISLMRLREVDGRYDLTIRQVLELISTFYTTKHAQDVQYDRLTFRAGMGLQDAPHETFHIQLIRHFVEPAELMTSQFVLTIAYEPDDVLMKLPEVSVCCESREHLSDFRASVAHTACYEVLRGVTPDKVSLEWSPT